LHDSSTQSKRRTSEVRRSEIDHDIHHPYVFDVTINPERTFRRNNSRERGRSLHENRNVSNYLMSIEDVQRRWTEAASC
jgi:hypothetical protein